MQHAASHTTTVQPSSHNQRHVLIGKQQHCAGERIFKIGEHLAKLQAKWLIVSYAPFALDFCPQRCRTRWISKITCLLRTETVTDCCYVNKQINVSLLPTKYQTAVDKF